MRLRVVADLCVLVALVGTAALWTSGRSAQAAEFRVMAWELVETTCPAGLSASSRDCQFTDRLKVPGGWLVRSTRLMREPSSNLVPPGLPGAGTSYMTGGALGTGVGLTFLPDPNHTWNPNQ